MIVEKKFTDFGEALEYAKNVLTANGFDPENMEGCSNDLQHEHRDNLARLMEQLQGKQRPTSVMPNGVKAQPEDFKLARLCYSFNKIYFNNFSEYYYSVNFNDFKEPKGE